jgi:hypothetical protein
MVALQQRCSALLAPAPACVTVISPDPNLMHVCPTSQHRMQTLHTRRGDATCKIPTNAACIPVAYSAVEPQAAELVHHAAIISQRIASRASGASIWPETDRHSQYEGK